MVDDQRRENSEMVLSKQIATAVQAVKWHRMEHWEFGFGLTQFERKIGKVVLGLATSHHEEIKLMQVRPAGQAGYPISLVASLDTVPVKCCVPLLEKKSEK